MHTYKGTHTCVMMVSPVVCAGHGVERARREGRLTNGGEHTHTHTHTYAHIQRDTHMCYNGVTCGVCWPRRRTRPPRGPPHEWWRSPQECRCGVTVLLEWCHSDVTVVLQWCYGGVKVLESNGHAVRAIAASRMVTISAGMSQ
jgi:hypothetical protein